MSALLKDIETILEDSIDVLAGPDVDIERLEVWRRHREWIFARLQNADFALSGEEGQALAQLIDQVLRVDAEVVVRLEKKLGDLGRQIITAGKMRGAFVSQDNSHTPALLHRAV